MLYLIDGGCKLIQRMASPIAVSSPCRCCFWPLRGTGSPQSRSAPGHTAHRGDSGGPFQGEQPPSNQGRKSARAVRFAMRPIRVEAHDTSDGGKE